jgi:hypothetical protein
MWLSVMTVAGFLLLDALLHVVGLFEFLLRVVDSSSTLVPSDTSEVGLGQLQCWISMLSGC